MVCYFAPLRVHHKEGAKNCDILAKTLFPNALLLVLGDKSNYI